MEEHVSENDCHTISVEASSNLSFSFKQGGLTMVQPWVVGGGAGGGHQPGAGGVTHACMPSFQHQSLYNKSSSSCRGSHPCFSLWQG